MSVDLKSLGIRANKLAREKGWWEDLEYNDLLIGSKLMLITSEVAEAGEELRKLGWEGMDKVYFSENGKPEGFTIEMADVIIRAVELCEEWGLDLEGAIKLKEEYNSTRKVKHGGKKF